MPGIKPIYRMSSEPLAQWVEQRVSLYGGPKGYADKIGTDHTWIIRLLKRKFRTIEINKADEVLCKDGTIHLRELYPELYEEL